MFFFTWYFVIELNQRRIAEILNIKVSAQQKMKSQTGKIFSFIIALCILLSVFCFASTQVNAFLPEDYEKLGAGPAKVAALKEPLKDKAVSLIQAVHDANTPWMTTTIIKLVNPTVAAYFLPEYEEKFELTGEISTLEDNKIVFRTDFSDKKDGSIANEKFDGHLWITVADFQEGTAYSVGEDGVLHKLARQYNFGSMLSLFVRPGYEVVIVK